MSRSRLTGAGSYSGLLPAAVDDATFGEIVRSQLHSDFVASEDAYVILAHFPRDVGGHDVPVLEFHAKSRIRQRLGDDALHLYGFFFGQGLRFSLLQKARGLCRNGCLNAIEQASFVQQLGDRQRIVRPVLKSYGRVA